VIVRISGEGQYRLADDKRDKVNEIDNAVVEAVNAGDEAKFQELFDKMLAGVREHGEPLGDDELVESEVILPPPDLTFEEAGREFTGEGLIPD
jgi:hypothetical protein